VTVESLDEKCAGLAAYVETLLQRGVWFPSTIATRSMRWFRLIERYMQDTGTPELTALKVVDFGARGVSSTESAALGGMAHLVNFIVTDNLMGIRFARHAYNAEEMPGFSIPATEHSVTTSWGQENELAFFEHILEVHGNKPGIGGVGRYPVSVVIDTYDQDQALRMWGTISRTSSSTATCSWLPVRTAVIPSSTSSTASNCWTNTSARRSTTRVTEFFRTRFA
jgi:nicotinamide phosphoribosyltransferase